MVELRRRFIGKPHLISEMRDFIRDGCLSIWTHPSDTMAISQLELAVSEAASNIILHGLQKQLDAQIELTLQIDRVQAVVTFQYPGCAFHPPATPSPDFAGRSESGYGLYLIQQSVDETHFSRDDTGLCTIRFTKNRTQSSQE